MSDKLFYIDKLVNLKGHIYDFMKNNNSLTKNLNTEHYFNKKYLPLRLAFNHLKDIDDSIYNFIVCFVYNYIMYDDNIKQSCKNELLDITKKYYI